MRIPNNYKDWKEYWIAALDNNLKSTLVDIALAPSLKSALEQATGKWPWAYAWELLGTIDLDDSEICIPISAEYRIIKFTEVKIIPKPDQQEV